MIDEKFDPLAYVTAAAPSVGFVLSEQRLAEIAEAFALVVRVGLPALTTQVAPAIEPAPVFTA